MRVLVTGSAGLIGTAVVENLSRDMTVAGLDRRGDPHAEARGAHFVCDILDRTNLVRIVRDFAPDAIVHLAARVDLDETADLHGYAANIEGVENLLSAIRETPSVRRAVWTSSQLVCRVGYTPKSPTDYQPDTVYGRSKVRTEEIVRAADGAGREWCIGRPTTVWGPGMSPHYRRFFSMIKRGRYFHVGGGPLLKSYSYVGNIAHQYRRLLEVPAEQMHRRTFYLADYTPIDLIAWCNALQETFGARPIPTVPQGVATLLARIGDGLNAVGFRKFPFNSFRLGNVLAEYQVDTRETEAVCGPLPYTMEQGIAETVAWFNALGR